MSIMHIVSINVGLPRTVEWRGKLVSTAIFKAPVAGPLTMEGYNLVGDQQADLSVHGGEYKAIYAYPAEHYAFWRAELPGVALGWGNFGENLTVEGLREEEVFVNDIYAVGTALLKVTEPRVPCYKLGIRFNDAQMTKRFLHSRRSGWYFAIERPGTIVAGDAISLVERREPSISMAEMFHLYGFAPDDKTLLERMVATPDLSPVWLAYAERQLANAGQG
jgi:MOSC domain-containing protein YiiM